MRWTAKEKLKVVREVLNHKITCGEAKLKYALSDEELISWISTSKKGQKLTQKEMIGARNA